MLPGLCAKNILTCAGDRDSEALCKNSPKMELERERNPLVFATQWSPLRRSSTLTERALGQSESVASKSGKFGLAVLRHASARTKLVWEWPSPHQGL
jgi:hypothetical protein